MFHVHALADVHTHAPTSVHAQGLESKPVVPVHVASLPSLFATTASHVASAPVLPVHVPTTTASHVGCLPSDAATIASHVASAPLLPVHVPRDSSVQAASVAGAALSEQAVLADADVHVLATDAHVLSAVAAPHVP